MLAGLGGVGGFFGNASGDSGTVDPVTLRGTSSDRNSNSASLTFTFPVGTQEGDRAVLFMSGAWAPDTPGGWTKLTEDNGIAINGEVVTRVLSAGDVSTGSVTVAFAASGICQLAGAVFEGAPNVRDYDGLRVLSATTTAVPIAGNDGDYALWYAGLNGSGSASPSCTKGSILETVANSPWLEMTGATLASGDITAGTVSASLTTTGESYVAAVTLIPAAYSFEDRVTDTAEQRLTSTGDVRVTTERIA